jgi:hypothetical protein
MSGEEIKASGTEEENDLKPTITIAEKNDDSDDSLTSPTITIAEKEG